MSKKAKFDTKMILPIVMAGAGGFAGNQLTTFIEGQTFMAGKEEFSPAVTAAIGIAGAIFVPSMSNLFQGMATVSVTELLEGLISKSGAKTPTTSTPTPTVSGISDVIQGIGYAGGDNIK